MRRLFSSLFALALVALASCGDSSGGAETATIERGSASEPRVFETVADGQELELEWGLQGGYHIWGAVQSADLDPIEVRLLFRLFDGDTQIGQADFIVDLFDDDNDGIYGLGGVTVFVFNDVDAEALDGRTLVMDVRATDRNGAQAVDQRTIVARFPF